MIDLTALYTNITPGRPVDTAHSFFILSRFLSLSLPLSLAISAPWGVFQETQLTRRVLLGNHNNFHCLI